MVLLVNPYNPYPFILLNLILSYIATLQAPNIMMSQKRQKSKDRMRPDYDKDVNVKTEIHIEYLVKKLRDIKSHQALFFKTLEKLMSRLISMNPISQKITEVLDY